jgi:crotonobetainyl-CoA:carnitine CoA-transferase CaiB-like acyl-CoA transferase
VLTSDRRPQQTADGWIHMLPYSRENYVDLFRAGGRDDLADDPRLESRATRAANVTMLYSAVLAVVRTRTTGEWLAFCDEHDIPCSAIVDLDDVVAGFPVEVHPVVGAYHVIPPPTRFDVTPASVRRPAPLIGQHGDEVLAEVGYTADEIAALREADVLRSR